MTVTLPIFLCLLFLLNIWRGRGIYVAVTIGRQILQDICSCFPVCTWGSRDICACGLPTGEMYGIYVPVSLSNQPGLSRVVSLFLRLLEHTGTSRTTCALYWCRHVRRGAHGSGFLCYVWDVCARSWFSCFLRYMCLDFVSVLLFLFWDICARRPFLRSAMLEIYVFE